MMRQLLFLLAALPLIAYGAEPSVRAMRCPNEGIGPQGVVDSNGKVHLIYLKGEDAGCDIFYVTSTDAAKTWSKPIRVNSQEGAAIATGTIRGPQLSLGRNGRVHVAWMGSQSAEPRGVNESTPMLYARLNDQGDAFEPQRNVITAHPGLDGGGSVAADATGRVAVAWHSPAGIEKSEANRTVWAVFSTDDGKTFGSETQLVTQHTGACGCCGMRSLYDSKGHLISLYRSANDQSRDMTAAYHENESVTSVKLQTWPTKTCPMSTASLVQSGENTIGAWETQGQIFLAPMDARQQAKSVSPPGKGNNRKHPALAVNKSGNVLLAWSEGTGWKKGGTVHWQVFDSSLNPVADATGSARGLAVWSLPTALCVDGEFVVIY